MIRTHTTDDFEKNLKRALSSENDLGLDLCKASLLDIFFGDETEIELRRWSARYRRNGVLRAYFDRRRGQLNGEFLIFYPNGNVWMKGGCKDDRLISSTLRLYLPNGERAPEHPLANNVIPFIRRK